MQKPRIVKSMICLSGDPTTLSKGWRDLIHTISHWVYNYRKGYKNHFGHSYQQAELELEISKFVISSGWLEGGLKSKVIILTKEEKRQKNLDHLQNLKDYYVPRKIVKINANSSNNSPRRSINLGIVIEDQTISGYSLFQRN